MATHCGSRVYIAPDAYTGGPYDGRVVDYWALGVILYALTAGVYPFCPDDCTASRLIELANAQQYAVHEMMIGSSERRPHRISAHVPSSAAVDPSTLSLVHHLLRVDPSRRADYNAVVRHPIVAAYGHQVYGRSYKLWDHERHRALDEDIFQPSQQASEFASRIEQLEL